MLNSEIEAAIEEKRKDKLPYDHYKNLLYSAHGYEPVPEPAKIDRGNQC